VEPESIGPDLAGDRLTLFLHLGANVARGESYNLFGFVRHRPSVKANASFGLWSQCTIPPAIGDGEVRFQAIRERIEPFIYRPMREHPPCFRDVETNVCIDKLEAVKTRPIRKPGYFSKLLGQVNDAGRYFYPVRPVGRGRAVMKLMAIAAVQSRNVIGVEGFSVAAEAEDVPDIVFET
jgi:hypothetical protein